MIRGKRLRAMHRLLDYALAESHELGLPHLERLLGAAALAVHDAIASDRGKRVVRQAAPGEPDVSPDNGARKAPRRVGART